MYSGMIAVWDQDQKYAGRLTEYLRRRSGLTAPVVLCSSEEALRQAADAGRIAVALVGRPAAGEPWLQGMPVLTLTEEREPGEDRIYKYQPAFEVFRALAGVQTAALRDSPAIGQPAGLRAVFSPVGGCLKTSFSLALGSVLAERRRCLFVNLEAHSGFRTLFGQQYPADLSDLLSCIREGTDALAKLPQTLQSLGRMQYIAPVIWPEDIREAEKHEIKDLLKILAGCGRFDEIVIDAGQDLSRPEDLLGWCDRIYCLRRADAFSAAKTAEYMSYLKVSGHESLDSRIRFVEVDGLAQAAAGPDQWRRWEQLLPAVRRILEEEEHHEEYGERGI